jgi:hypothetical protein
VCERVIGGCRQAADTRQRQRVIVERRDGAGKTAIRWNDDKTGQGPHGRMRVDSQCQQAASSRDRLGHHVTNMSTAVLTWRRVVVQRVTHSIVTHPRHTTLTGTSRTAKQVISQCHLVTRVGATASHSAEQRRRPSPIPADSERETRWYAAAVCQWSSGGVARWPTTRITWPPRDDGPDVQHEPATHGALAARVGHKGAVGHRVIL